METVTWPVQQQFYFPEEVGVAQQVKEFSIIPIWEKMPRKESFRLTGIYRITATILFQQGQCACEGVLIDDLDLNDGAHYFEYGCPLEVDLPLRAYDSINLQVKDSRANIQPDGTVIFAFTVECNLNVNEPHEQPQKEQSVPEQKREEMKQPVGEKQEKPKQPAQEKPKQPAQDKPKEPVQKKQDKPKEPVGEKQEKSKKPVQEKQEILKPIHEQQEKPKQPALENEDKSPVEEKEKVQLFVQELQQPTNHEFSFLHHLKEEYSLFSLSPSPQIKSDHNK